MLPMRTPPSLMVFDGEVVVVVVCVGRVVWGELA